MKDFIKTSQKNTSKTFKISPHVDIVGAVEIEKLILGTCIMIKEKIHEVDLQVSDFAISSHRKIYTALLDIETTCGDIDFQTLRERLLKNGDFEAVGGMAYLVGLVENFASAANLQSHVLIVKEYSYERQFNQALDEIKNSSDIKDIFERIDFAQEKILGLGGEDCKKESKICEDSVSFIFEKNSVLGTGYRRIDHLIGGWEAQNLVILAARPGMGKTTLMLNFMLALGKSQIPCAIFSLEQSKKAIFKRLLANITKLKTADFKNNRKKLEDAAANSIPKEMYYDDTGAIWLCCMNIVFR